MDLATLYGIGIGLFFAGILVVFLAIILLFVFGSKGEGKVKGGGAIIIGPVPIIFGTDKKSIKTVLLLSITLTILLIVLVIVSYLVSR
jgi:uncharacterized protein (TIGR00304 family)